MTRARRPSTVAPAALLLSVLVAACGGEPPRPPREPVGAHRSRTSAETERAFWTWFIASEATLHAEPDPLRVAEAARSRLAAIHADLELDVGPKGEGARQLVISAGGNRTAFPVVRSLVAGAPPLPRWRLVELRQRRRPMVPVTLGDLVVAPEQVEFALHRQGAKVGVALYFDPALMQDHDDTRRVGYQLLDQALGERDVVMKVGTIDWRPKDAVVVKRSDLTRLGDELDAMVIEPDP